MMNMNAHNINILRYLLRKWTLKQLLISVIVFYTSSCLLEHYVLNQYFPQFISDQVLSFTSFLYLICCFLYSLQAHFYAFSFSCLWMWFWDSRFLIFMLFLCPSMAMKANSDQVPYSYTHTSFLNLLLYAKILCFSFCFSNSLVFSSVYSLF